MGDRAAPGWRFHKFGLLVTGEGEAEFLPSFFRSLMESGTCSFEVIRRIGQRSPLSSPRRELKMLGTGKIIPDKDQEEIGLPARHYIKKNGEHALVLLVDDLEHERRDVAREVFQRYREALDKLLLADRRRASVHFLVNMIEAYYFADAAAVNAELGTVLPDHASDVEDIRNPKGELKKLVPGFDERSDGARIAARLDLRHVLSNPQSCASLRTLMAWCASAIGASLDDEYRLETGIYSVITGPQLSSR